MTENWLNLETAEMVVKTIEGRLAKTSLLSGRMAAVSAEWLASVLVDNERLRRRETELQADNTRLHLKAEAALNREHNLMMEVDCLRDVLGQGDGSKVALAQRDEAMLKARIAEQGHESARAVLADVTKERDEARAALEERKKSSAVAICELMQQRDEARALNGEMAAKLDRAKGDSDAASRTIGDLTRERDEALARSPHSWNAVSEVLKPMNETLRDAAKRVVRERDDATVALVAANASIAECRQALLDAQREMVSVTESRDVLASWRAIPPELARLYRAAKRMLAHAGNIDQRIKLAEECGEYIAEELRRGDRFSVAKVNHEIHDVLTVALSLCEPALMAASAERLEGRLK